MFDARVRVKARFIYATKGAFSLEKKRERFFVSGNFVDFSFQTIITNVEMSLSLSFFLSFFTRGYARVEDDVHILNSQDILRTN